MPTPVKSAFPSPAPAAARAATTPASADAGGAESFQDELVRRRRPETPPAARKAEEKRVARPRNAPRAGRRKPVGKAEEPDVSMAEGSEPAAEAPGPAESTDVDSAAQQVEEVHAAEESASSDSQDGDEPGTDAAALGAGVVAAPAADVANQTPADGTPEQTAAKTDEALPAPVAQDLVRARSIDYARGSADGTADGRDQPPGATSPDGKASPFLGEAADAPAEGARPTAEKHAPRQASPAPVADPVAQVGQATLVEQLVTAADRTPNGAAAAADPITESATAGLLNVPTERGHAAAPAVPAASPPPPEVRFATTNHENIVTSMRAEVLPNGGSMRIRLDPPQLGALQVTVQVRDGLVTAAFETSNDEATRLLGHSLNQLKSVLESHGVAVDKLQVQQAPRDANPSGTNEDARREQGHSHEQEHHARQEQQRREMLQKMWRRLAGGQDPLDLTA